MSREMSFGYTTIGHVTADVMADGSRRPGGSAFYSALQAARLGQRALIITQGARREIEELLEPFRGELELEILPAAQTTALQTRSCSGARTQRLLAWAGPMGEDLGVDTEILHVAPVARETPQRWRGRAGFVGLTPQGLVREWFGAEREIVLQAADAPVERAPGGCDAIVVSENERASCSRLIVQASSEGTLVAVTAGAAATSVHFPGGSVIEVEVPAIGDPVEDIGAGDVFAAAFFVTLAQGQPPADAAAFANAASAVRISGAGANAIGDRRAIEARLGAAG